MDEEIDQLKPHEIDEAQAIYRASKKTIPKDQGGLMSSIDFYCFVFFLFAMIVMIITI